MMMAAVGLSPKMAVRSTLLERGSAEAPSLSVLTSERDDFTSVVVLDDDDPLALGAVGDGVALGFGVTADELEDDDEPDGGAAGGVVVRVSEVADEPAA